MGRPLKRCDDSVCTLESPCRPCRKRKQNREYKNTQRKTPEGHRLNKIQQARYREGASFRAWIQVYRKSDQHKLNSKNAYIKDRASGKTQERSRITNLARHNLTPSDYDALLSRQDGGCAICRSSSPRRRGRDRLVVDHDHQTGKVRGLLCHPCNLALGLFHDNPQRLVAAAAYVGNLR